MLVPSTQIHLNLLNLLRGVRGEWHLLKPRTTVIPAQAGGVVQGCTVYGPKDGIQTCLMVAVFLDSGLRRRSGAGMHRLRT